MANSFTIKIDSAPVKAQATRIATLAESALLRLSAADAVNAVASRFDEIARAGMNANLKLTDEYIASRMRLTRAAATTKGVVRAEIVARGDLTIMGHYPNAQLRAEGTVTRANPGGTRGRRPSGVAVEIKTGQAAVEPQWFLMRLRNSGKTGVFVRTTAGGGRPVHKYGPSPYSLFRHQIETRSDALADDLAATVTARAADTIERAFR